jgi:hypothetical protein
MISLYDKEITEHSVIDILNDETLSEQDRRIRVELRYLYESLCLQRRSRQPCDVDKVS